MAFPIRCCLLLIAFIFGAVGPAAAKPKRVILLSSYGRDFMPWSAYVKAIRTELDRQSASPLNIDDHSLVSVRFSEDNQEQPFVDYLRAIYAKQRPDLIISIGAPAAAFVQRHRDELFPATPMVLAAVDYRRVRDTALTENDTVVAVSINFLAAVENILRVLPDTKNVDVVVGNSPSEKNFAEEWAKQLKPLESRTAFTWYNQLSFDDILKRAAALPPHTVLFWGTMAIDAAGVVHEAGTALSRLYAVANAPIFSYNDAYFG